MYFNRETAQKRKKSTEKQRSTCVCINVIICVCCRSEFAVGVIGKYIYAVAGRTRDETFYSTERYDITEDRWEFVDPYPVNKYGHEGTVLSGKLYITGGITSSSTSKQVCAVALTLISNLRFKIQLMKFRKKTDSELLLVK